MRDDHNHMQGALFFPEREGMSKKDQKRNGGKSKAKIANAFHVLLFAVSCFYYLEFEDGNRGRERVEEDRKRGW